MRLPTHYQVYEVDIAGQRRRYLGLRLDAVQLQGGLLRECVLGELDPTNNDLSAEDFKPNEVFVRFVGWVLSKHLREIPALMAEVVRQGNGQVHVVDQRTRQSDGSVPPRDILGSVEVEDGKPVRYTLSPNYELFTEDGLPQLDEYLMRFLYEELAALARGEAPE